MIRAPCIFLVLLLQRTATDHAQNAPDKERGLQPWFEADADLVFVVHSHQRMTSSLVKVLNRKYTVWTYRSPGLWEHILKNRLLNLRTTVFADVQGDYVNTVIQSLGSQITNGIATEWVFLLEGNDFDKLVQAFYDSPAHMALSAIAVDGKSVSKSLRCMKLHQKNRCFSNTFDFPKEYQQRISKRNFFAGDKIRLACLDIGGMKSCRTQGAFTFMRLLRSKNVSFTRRFYTSTDAMFSDLIVGKVGVAVAPAEVTENLLTNQTYADVECNYKTFYALHDGTYVVSLFDAIGRSPCVILATSCLAFCVATIVVVRRIQFPSLALTFPSHEVLFLLASLFGTSYAHPRSRVEGKIRILVYAVWMLGILPFSVYFRSQLTSLVTTARPRDHMDTIAELERGLDDDSVFPCVVKESSAWESLEKGSNGSGSFFEKLRSSYLRHKHEGIEKRTLYGCVRCATSKNRVCFVHSMNVCFVKSRFKDVGEFQERFTMTLTTYPISKESTLTRPLRRLMSAIREMELTRKRPPRCDIQATSARSTFKLWDFFAQLSALVCAAGVVLAAEIAANRIAKRRQ